ncbi:MAG: GNAT family N-acetyltransferase [Planctomycetota bacterium]
MAVHPSRHVANASACRLAPFDPRWAEHVVAWVRTPLEAYWLAPKTPPPLTAERLVSWRGADQQPFMLLAPGSPGPVAYGELNRLSGTRREYWLGHLIVDPNQRGRGLGVQLTRLLLAEAFDHRGARRVTLVVFPENQVALRCYRAAGMCEDGCEWHYFPAYDRRESLVRLTATRTFWR